MQQYKIEQLDLQALKPNPRNARTHSKKQIHQIAASIKEFGFTNPILVDRDGVIIAGHGRAAAAKKLNLGTVPVLRIEHLTEAQKRAYVLADNRLAEKAGWDKEILRIELGELAVMDLSFELELTGFETAEIDAIIEGDAMPARDPADEVPSVEDGPPMTRRGDLWILGDHRLYCGDAREAASYQALLGGERVRLVFSDPPYNVPIDGHVCGLGSVKHREFAFAAGEMSRSEFVAFLQAVFSQLAAVSLDGAIHFHCMDWRHMREILEAGEAVYTELKNLCVWTKDNGGMGSFYRSQHELVFVWKHGNAPHVNTIELGRFGRYRTNVWPYAGINTLKKGRKAELAMHPTVKPVALVMDAIKDASRRGDLVLDCFGGSGTTLIAAEKSGRRARLIEFDERYCDVIVRRWEQLTGGVADRVPSGDEARGSGGNSLLSVDERAELALL